MPEQNTPLASKHIVQLDDNGFFQGMVMVDEDPIERGTFQIPPNALDITAPVLSEGQTAYWNFEGESWVYVELNPDPTPAQYLPIALLNIDLDVDRIYSQVVGLRGPEYEMAENEARAFLLNPAMDPIPQSVTDWASIKGWTNEAAAQNIVTQAESWRHLSLNVIRPARLQTKEQLRVAATLTAMKAIESAWAGYVVAWRTALGLAT